MNSSEILSKKQIIYIASNFLLGSSLIVLTGLKYAKKDTFICDTLAFSAGFLLHIMMYYVVYKFPNMEFTQILDVIFNPVCGRIVALVYLYFSICLLCLIQNNITGLVTTMVMPKTPGWIIAITTLLISAYAMKLGIKTFGLNVEILFPFIFFLIIFLYIIIVFKFFNLGNLLPVFTQNLTTISKGFLDIFLFPYVDSCILIFIYSLSNEKPRNFKIIRSVFFLVSFLLIFRSVIVIFVLGSKEAGRFAFPLFEAVIQIGVGKYIQRLDILLLTVWTISSYFKLATVYYVILKCLEYIFKLPDYKKVSLALTIAMLPLSMNTFKTIEDTYLNSVVTVPIMKLPILIITILVFLRVIYLSLKNNMLSS